MANDPQLDELIQHAVKLKRQAAELFARHELLHVDLVRIFERIKRLHYAHPVIRAGAARSAAHDQTPPAISSAIWKNLLILR